MFFVLRFSICRGPSHRIRMSWHHSPPSNSCCQEPRHRPKHLHRRKNWRGKSHSSYNYQLLRCFTEHIQWQSICVLSVPKNVPVPLLVERPLEFCCTWCKRIQVSEMQEEVQASLSLDSAYWKRSLQISWFTTSSEAFPGLDWSFLPPHFFVNILGGFSLCRIPSRDLTDGYIQRAETQVNVRPGADVDLLSRPRSTNLWICKQLCFVVDCKLILVWLLLVIV